MTYKPLGKEEQETVRRLLLSGKSHNQIAKLVGRSQSTISNFARREAIPTLNRTPVEAIESHKVKALADRIEAASEMMEIALQMARRAENGRELKEASTAFGILCDKLLLMEGLPTSRTESHTKRSPEKTIDLEKEFAKLDEMAAQHEAQIRRDGE